VADILLQQCLADQLQRAGLSVSPESLPPLLFYLEELARWNQRHNLTAIRDPLTAIENHLVDSLTLLPHLPQGCRLLDFGSGAGLPGLPLRIVRPDLRLTSLDAVGKKLAFQRHFARLLKLREIDFVHARLEDFAADPHHQGQFERVVFRAVGEIEKFAPLARPLLKPAAELLAMKGPEGEEDFQRFSQSPLKGWSCRACLPSTLPNSGARRTLLIFVKD